MKQSFVLCIVLLGFVSQVSSAQRITPSSQVAQVNGASVQGKGLDTPVSVSAQGATLESVLLQIASEMGTKATFSNEVYSTHKPVTIKLNKVPARQALAQVLKGTGIVYKVYTTGELAFAGSPSKAVSSTGVITGKVVDSKSGKAIAGASISIGTDSRSVATGEDGNYRIAGVSAGVQSVTARYVGYAKQIRSVSVGEGATVTADFKLEPSANVLDQVIVTGTVAQTELKAVPNAITVITAKQIEERGITRIDQLFRGDIPGLFAQNVGSGALLDEVTMFSRGATALSGFSAGTSLGTNPIKTYVDGVELADSKYLSQIDPKAIERIEILTGPQASTVYGSNAINGVMQIFTKRGMSSRPQLTLNLQSGWVENNFSQARTSQHDYSAQLNGVEGRLSYNAGGSWNYMGPWTPAKQSARTGGFGGVRLESATFAGRITADMTLRRTLTQNLQRGDVAQSLTGYRESGQYNVSNGSGRVASTVSTLSGQTIGLSLSYALNSWWSHDLGLGQDASDTETRTTERAYGFSVSDTNLSLTQSHSDRRSMRYTTTARIPVSPFFQLTVTTGLDSWQNLVSSLSASPQALTGTLTNVNGISRRPGHNTGGYMQTQVSIVDQLFFTYGLRMEKNPTIGDKARVIPGRYGAAYTREMGPLTAKLRGSYGRSIRPPQSTLKNGVPITNASFIAVYGNYDATIANPDLTPEYQQGSEGGLEMYMGTRGSIVVTRYNQTVDNLIATAAGVDSVRTLAPCPDTGCLASSAFRDADGYAFRYQTQFLNLASIRNQGWELQGTMNVGPFTTRGTFSWTKSRVLGVTPRYRSLFANNNQYRPGATFQYLPEHTWALGITYAQRQSSIRLNLTGIGQMRNGFDDFYYENLSSNVRLQQNQFNVTNTGGYTSVHANSAYAMADLNASHRFSQKLEALLQIQNIADQYVNDWTAQYASIGRQAKLGFRLRAN